MATLSTEPECSSYFSSSNNTLSQTSSRLPRPGGDEVARILRGGCGEEPVRRPRLDDAAPQHDCGMIGDEANDREIVADDHDRQALARAQILQEIEEIALHRNIEASGSVRRR